jgi:hypothetical protein
VSNAKIYVVHWGPNVVADIKNGIGEFYSAVASSNMMDWLDQYQTTGKSLDGRDGTNQHIGKGQYLGAVTITPSLTSNRIDDTDIQAEMQRQIDAGKVPHPDDNTVYMIYFPPGIKITAAGMMSCSQFCAYHGFKGTPTTDHFYYGVMPDLGGACAFGCGFGNHFATASSISAHELLEAITDPFPTPGSSPAYPQAWNDDQGNEIADICAGSNNTLRTGAGRVFTVQSEFDNQTGTCTTQSWTSP